MTDIGPSPYISDAAIIAWLQEKSDAQNVDLENLIHTSDQRGDLMKELGNLKAEINGKGADTETILAHMQAIEDNYAETPYADELNAMLEPMKAALAPIPDPAAQAEIAEIGSNPDGITNDVQARIDELAKQMALPSISGFKADFSSKIDVEVDALGRIDQLALIQIQEQMSDAHQTEQLASNILSSRDQTSNAIVGNIRG